MTMGAAQSRGFVSRLSCYGALVASISKAELLKLDVAERLELIEELWDSIASDPQVVGQLPLTDDERRLLDARLQGHRASPGAARPWSEVRAAILKQR
jgi:putative addiction module component (TIGR02574 family)